jgi:hypothetical protein
MDSTKIYELVGSGSGIDVVRDFSVAIIGQMSEASLPLEGDSLDKWLEAVKIYVKGLQDPESDLFLGEK